MKHELEFQAHTIVAVGDLNPAIFQPAWFAAEGLITNHEAQAAKIQMISAQAASFQVDWLSLQALPDRFVAATENEAFYRHLVDLVGSTFSKLSHTPISALGINYSCHYRLEDAAQWMYISDELAPKTRWAELLDKPVLRSLTMGSPRATGPKGHVQIRVEPSVRIGNGVFIDINNHYDLSHEELGCRAMVNVLSNHWSDTFANYRLFSTGYFRMTEDQNASGSYTTGFKLTAEPGNPPDPCLRSATTP